MKRHYAVVAKRLKQALTELDQINETSDLPALHRFVTDLKVSLPETHAYEQSQLLLDGLRVHTPGKIAAYAERLRVVLADLREHYWQKAQ